MDIDRRALLGLAGAGLAGGLLWSTSRTSRAGHVSAPATRPGASDDQISEYVEGNAAFGLDLLDRLAADEPEANHMVSPPSVSGALAMAWIGARGDTETQMREALRYPHDQEDLHPTVGALQYDLDGRGEDAGGRESPQFWRTNRFELAVANAMWGQRDYPFRESFLETVEENYGEELREVDFVDDPEGTSETINDWAAGATNGQIDELFPEDSIDDLTRLVLTNAVYLLADWEQPFDPDDTEDREFTAVDGSTARVPTMEQEEEFPVVSDPEADYRAIELPYVGGDVSMVIVLPVEGEFESFRSSVDGAWLLDLFAELDDAAEREVQLRMPRFEFETDAALSDHLEALGMSDAFDSRRADFDGIVPLEEIRQRLFVFEIYHDTYVAVDEAGTEAAAATGVQMGVESGPTRFTVDRPFLFCIRDRPTDAVLFLGRVVDAAAATDS